VCLRVLLKGRLDDELDSQKFLSRFGVLVLPYREQYFWWEFVNVVRRAVLIVVINFGNANSASLQLAIAFAIILIFLFAQVLVSPYKLNLHNHLAFTWLSVLLFTVVSAVLFDTDIQSEPTDSTINQLPASVIAQLGIDTSGSLTNQESQAYSAFIIMALIFVLLLTVGTMIYEFRAGKKRKANQRGINYDFEGIAKEKKLLADLFPESSVQLWRRARKFAPESRAKWLHDLLALHHYFFPKDGGEEEHFKSSDPRAGKPSDADYARPSNIEPLSMNDFQ